MNHEFYADRTPLPPAAIPLVDFENKLLPVQFVVDPPNDLDWNKMNEDDEEIINRLSVNERDKIDLLDKYLDLIYIDKDTKEVLTSKEFKIRQEKEQKAKKDEIKNKIIETLPNSTKSSNTQTISNSTQLTSSMKQLNTNKIEQRKKKLSFNLGSLSSLTQRLSSLKRSMSKRFRKNFNNVNTNIGNLVRRGSLRLSRRSNKLSKSESQTKSTNNLDQTKLSTNSLNSSTNKSSTDKSPSKQSTKSSPNKSPTKSINSSICTNVEQIENSIIPNNFILVADMHIDDQPSYRDEIIRNYLSTAKIRFLNESNSKTTTEKSVLKVQNNSSEFSSHLNSTTSLNSASSNSKDDYAQCVNTGCLNFGKSSLNYLCTDCHDLQKKELIEIKSNIEAI